MSAANERVSASFLTVVSRRDLIAGVVKRGLQVLFMLALWGTLFFAAAGRLDVLRAWIYIAASLVIFVINILVVAPRNPEVIMARAKVRAGTKPYDKVFGMLFGLSFLAVPVVAGLDAVRFGWAAMPASTFIAGMVLYVVSNIPILWSMVVNPHLEKTVRIQNDRGHQVVSDGPYRYVRHPMYVGVILQQIALPFLFGSLWTFAPVGLVIVSLIFRTTLEDRTLREELEGYVDYAQRVRYRLCPWVW